MKPEVAAALDLKTHFKTFDYREAQIQKERAEKERRDLQSSCKYALPWWQFLIYDDKNRPVLQSGPKWSSCH